MNLTIFFITLIIINDVWNNDWHKNCWNLYFVTKGIK